MTVVRVDQALAEYRRKMTPGQLAALEGQFFERVVLDIAGLPLVSVMGL